MRQPPEAVIFDFDFTLADSSRGIVDCVTFALGRLGFAKPRADEIIRTIGLSLPEIFKQFTGKTDKALTQQFVDCFHQRADKVMDSQTILYDSVRPLLRILRASRIRTAIVSTKLTYRLRGILRLNNLSSCFDMVIGADDVKSAKPDPEGLLLVLRQLSVARDRAVYVGDHIIDAQAACKAQLPFVAVMTGTHIRTDFEAYPYVAIIQDLRELPSVLELQEVN